MPPSPKKIKAALAQDQELNALAEIDVDTNEGVVTLQGSVANLKGARKRAAKFGAGYSGVKTD